MLKQAGTADHPRERATVSGSRIPLDDLKNIAIVKLIKCSNALIKHGGNNYPNMADILHVE